MSEERDEYESNDDLIGDHGADADELEHLAAVSEERAEDTRLAEIRAALAAGAVQFGPEPVAYLLDEIMTLERTVAQFQPYVDAARARADERAAEERCKECHFYRGHDIHSTFDYSFAHPFDPEPVPTHEVGAQGDHSSVVPSVEEAHERERLMTLLNEPGYGLDAVWMEYGDSILHGDGDEHIAREIIENAIAASSAARLAALEAALAEEVDERDRLERLLDQFSWAVAPISVIGEHSSGNDPWKNALDLLIDWKARAERAEDALETIHIQATGIGYEVAHRYFVSPSPAETPEGDSVGR